MLKLVKVFFYILYMLAGWLLNSVCGIYSGGKKFLDTPCICGTLNEESLFGLLAISFSTITAKILNKS